MKKKPTSKFDPKKEKEPKSRVSVSTEDTIILSFKNFDTEFRICKDDCQHKTFFEIGEHLRTFQNRTWSDIDSHHDRDHAIEINLLNPLAITRLQEIHQDDIDVLWSFHFSGLQRLWGIRELNMVKVLWWDPDHQVYETKKKHT